MKRLLIILGIVLSASSIYSQQSALYTQYMHNPFVLNPAIAGTVNYFQFRSIHRFQWIGITDAPVTNSLSLYGPVSAKSKDMGYGGTIYNDATGPTSRTGLTGAFAYNTAINDEIRVSFGLNAGILQYKSEKIEGIDDNDKAMPKTITSKFLPDAAIGVYMYSTNFHVGFSADRLFNSKLVLAEDQKALGKLKSHFYLIGAYNYIFNRKYALESSVNIRGVSPAPIQLDFNVKAIYRKIGWFGVSFRTQDAISFLGGYIFNNKIYIGYSYDYNISPLRKYSTGSHELMFGYRFNPLK
jgi:type IX secretion system PorP/SprF family membrane protein